MKFLLVDDETLALDRLCRLLNELGHTSITAFNDPAEVRDKINRRELEFDIAFIDISMPQINGLELANHILEMMTAPVFIVFQTAYDEYALEAFQSGGMDYILKPVTKERLEETLLKIKRYKQETIHPKTQFNGSNKILGKRGQKIYLIDIDDIFYIKADLDEVIVKLEHIDVYVKKKIGECSQWLEGKNFFRIHRSVIVNVDKIDSMTSIEQSKLYISFHGIEDKVTSSKDGAKEFREYLEKKILS